MTLDRLTAHGLQTSITELQHQRRMEIVGRR